MIKSNNALLKRASIVVALASPLLLSVTQPVYAAANSSATYCGQLQKSWPDVMNNFKVGLPPRAKDAAKYAGAMSYLIRGACCQMNALNALMGAAACQKRSLDFAFIAYQKQAKKDLNS